MEQRIDCHVTNGINYTRKIWILTGLTREPGEFLSLVNCFNSISAFHNFQFIFIEYSHYILFISHLSKHAITDDVYSHIKQQAATKSTNLLGDVFQCTFF